MSYFLRFSYTLELLNFSEFRLLLSNIVGLCTYTDSIVLYLLQQNTNVLLPAFWLDISYTLGTATVCFYAATTMSFGVSYVICSTLSSVRLLRPQV